MGDFNLQEASKPRPMLWVGLLASFVAVGGWLLWNRAPEGRDKQAAEMPRKSNSQDQIPPAVADDDGIMLWVSPTSGPPLSLSYLPPGTQLLVQLRPAALAQHAEGEKVLAAMGPSGQQAKALIKHATGATWDELEELLIAVVPKIDGQLELTWRARLKTPWSAEELARRFPSSSTEVYHGQTYQAADTYACFLPLAEKEKMLVVCPVGNVRTMIDSQAAAPPLPRDFQRLLEQVDSQRTGTVVLLNRFLETSGAPLLVDRGEPLREVLHTLFKSEVTAVALSIHWDQHFFWELRCTPTLNHQPHTYADQLRGRLQALAEEAEEVVGTLSLHPFGKNVATRFPDMLRILNRYARFAAEDRHVVVRGYLPLSAGHNLLMAAELLLNRPGGAAPIASSPDLPPRNVSQQLDQVTSLTFVKETLQQALELLSDDIGVHIQIAGRDLQLEGITKNQSLGLDLRDRPAREILLEILLRANPDRTATGPADPKQQLVYVVRTDEDGTTGIIVVTTRAAARRRGETLPAALVAP